MLLRSWRLKKKLKLAEAAKFLGLNAVSTLNDIERGLVFPSLATIATIQGATGGEVNALDHVAACRRANPSQFSQLLADGRAAAKTYRSAAKPKESRDGGKSSRRK